MSVEKFRCRVAKAPEKQEAENISQKENLAEKQLEKGSFRKGKSSFFGWMVP